jgi:hypothetical protein
MNYAQKVQQKLDNGERVFLKNVKNTLHLSLYASDAHLAADTFPCFQDYRSNPPSAIWNIGGVAHNVSVIPEEGYIEIPSVEPVIPPRLHEMPPVQTFIGVVIPKQEMCEHCEVPKAECQLGHYEYCTFHHCLYKDCGCF